MPSTDDVDADDATPYRHSDLLNVSEDYFPPLPPRPQVAPQLSTNFSVTPSRPPPLSHASSSASLAAKATTAISLPEGVYAQQQDGVSSGNASGSVTTAPSFSEGDTGSMRSLAPTMETCDGGEEGVERMLTEILEEDQEEGILAGISKGMRLGPDAGGKDEDEDSSEDLDSDADSVGSQSGDERGDTPEEERLKRFRSHRKHFFILSTAGKPIYSFHGSDSLVIPHLGAISAMISSFSSTATHDTLQSFSTPTTLFSILPLPPLYLLAISSVPYETPHHLSSQMSLLHSQILSTLTQPTLVSAFKNRSNFDLRRLLGGTETFLQSLCQNLPRSTSHLLNNALSILHLRATHRKTLHSLLLTHRAPSLLYGLILAPHQLIAVLRPTRHSLHPSDLQLLFNMLFNTPSFHEIGTEHWIPLCLPKFNSKGFLHVYICFFARDLCVVLVSADREGFYELREMREKLVRDMVEKGLLAELQDKVKGYANPVGKVLRHWVVKERGLVQITMPRCRGKRRRKKRRKKSGAERGGEESAAEEARDDTKEEEKDDDDDDNDTVKEHNSNSNNINNRDPDPNPDSPSDSDSDYDTSSRFVPIWRQLWSQVHPQANPGGGSSKGKVAFITISSSPSPSPSSASSSDLETITTTQRHALLHITANYEIYAVGRRGRSKEEIVAAAREVLRWVRREEERVWVMSGATF